MPKHQGKQVPEQQTAPSVAEQEPADLPTTPAPVPAAAPAPELAGRGPVAEPDQAPAPGGVEPDPVTVVNAIIRCGDEVVEPDPDLPVEALSPAEMDAIKECERDIEKGLDGFLEVGAALLRVQEGRLYRGDFATFEEYLKERWGLSKSRGYQLIDASKVATELRSDPELPSTVVDGLNEGQARELAKVKDPVQRREVAREVAKDQGKTTAKKIAAAAAKVTGKPDKAGPEAKGTGKAADQPEPYEAAEHPFTEAVREMFRALANQTLAGIRVQESDPSTVTLADLDVVLVRIHVTLAPLTPRIEGQPVPPAERLAG